MTTLWAFIVLIGVLIFIHELGHYFAARSVGVRVERFSIGFPPRLISFTSVEGGWEFHLFFTRRSESGKRKWQPVLKRFIARPGRPGSSTEYCIALIPLGGYVKMAGMIDESLDTTIQHQPDELMSKSAWAKTWVMSAGVIMNVILAYVLYSTIAWHVGEPIISNEPVIAELMEGKPAQEEGLLPGDRIVSINGEPVSTWEEMAEKIHRIPNSPVTLEWEREGSLHTTSFLTSFQIADVNGKLDTLGIIGIAPLIETHPIGFIQALNYGFRFTANGFGMLFTSIRYLVTGQATLKELGGPIFIAQIAGEYARAGWIPFLSFMALISINLAFINVLPIPGLDGGHILIILIEAVLRRPLSIRTRVTIQQVGMAFLLLLMVTVIVNDLGRIFGN